jgi:tetratricopeptide (TPR) repeat protein
MERAPKKLYVLRLLEANLSSLIYLVLALATFIAFERLCYSNFVNYDDDVYVTENPHVNCGITADSIFWAFTNPHCNMWHPLTSLSHMLDCQLFGLVPFWHHLTSLLFHIAGTLLLFWVLKRMTGEVWLSAFVAAVFALHPLHVESVAWVAERKDVLSGFFWMLTMAAYVLYAERPGIGRYLLVVLVFCLALMAKPMVVTLPFVLLLLDYWPLGRFQWEWRSGGKLSLPSKSVNAGHPRVTAWRLVGEKIPLFALVVISSAVTFIVQKSTGAVPAREVFSPTIRITNALISYLTYIGKMFWPSRLAVFYPHPVDTVSIWLAVVAALLLLAVSIWVILSARNHRYLLVGWLWYLGTLVPVIGLVQVGGQARADRYMYLPMVGLLIIIAWGFGDLAAKWCLRKFIPVLSTGLCLSALMVCTWLQVGYWRDSFTLFTHTLEVTSNNYVAHLNLGNVLLRQKKVDKAIAHYKKAIQSYSDYIDAHYNLGLALGLEKRYDEAIEQYYTVLRLKPNHWKAQFRMANAFVGKGQTDEAIEHYNKTLQLKPNDAEVYNNLALALVKKEKINEAITHYNKSLELNPDSPEVLGNLANALVKLKEFDQAVIYFEKALALKPDFAEAHYNFANALRMQGRLHDAAKHYNKALKLDPNDADVHCNLGLTLANSNRYAEAVDCYKTAIQLRPDFAEAHYNLGIALVNQGKLDGAIKHFRQVLHLYPEDAEMHCNLGVLLVQKGRIEQAIEEFQTALRFDPNFSRAREQLQAALAKKTDTDPQ